MSRRHTSSIRDIIPDLLLGSQLVAKFINLLMIDGKKTVAENILYSALRFLEKKIKKDKLFILEMVINQVKPIVEVKSRRVGGTTYQIPVEVKPTRSNTLAIRWIILAARKRKDKTMFLRLVNEFSDVLNNKGLAIKMKDDVHRMAESNKAFAHYRW